MTNDELYRSLHNSIDTPDAIGLSLYYKQSTKGLLSDIMSWYYTALPPQNRYNYYIEGGIDLSDRMLARKSIESVVGNSVPNIPLMKLKGNASSETQEYAIIAFTNYLFSKLK